VLASGASAAAQAAVDAHGSVTISAPNGDQPIWSFGETVPKRTAKVTIAHSRKRPSRLLLPVVPGREVPTGLPPCPGLRGEPCREYAPIVNRKG